MVKRRATRKTVRRAARRYTSIIRRGSGGRRSIGSFFKKGVVGETVAATGASLLTSSLVSKVMPRYATVVGAGAGYMAGGLTGMMISEVAKYSLGMPSVVNMVTGIIPGMSGIGTQSNVMGDIV